VNGTAYYTNQPWNLTRTAPATVTEKVENTGDFGITVIPYTPGASTTLAANRSVTLNLVANNVSGGTGTVNLAVVGYPAYVTPNLSASSVAVGNAVTLTLYGSANVPGGVTQFGLQASLVGGPSHTFLVSLGTQVTVLGTASVLGTPYGYGYTIPTNNNTSNNGTQVQHTITTPNPPIGTSTPCYSVAPAIRCWVAAASQSGVTLGYQVPLGTLSGTYLFYLGSSDPNQALMVLPEVLVDPAPQVSVSGGNLSGATIVAGTEVTLMVDGAYMAPCSEEQGCGEPQFWIEGPYGWSNAWAYPYSWSENGIDVTLNPPSDTAGGTYYLYVDVCGEYFDPDGYENGSCVEGPVEFQVQAAPPSPSVTIQVQNGFVSANGNGLVLLGGPGGLTTTAITATGSPAGGTVTWSAGPRLQINGVNSANASVSGTAQSASAGDTWISVLYQANNQSASASVRFTVLNPTTFQAASPYGGAGNTQPFTQAGQVVGYITSVSYYAYDQMGAQISLPGITDSETLTTVSNPYGATFSPPDGQPQAGGSGNDNTGRMVDSLSAYLLPGGLPANFTASRNQSWTVNGFAFKPAQVQTYGLTSATVTSQVFSRQ